MLKSTMVPHAAMPATTQDAAVYQLNSGGKRARAHLAIHASTALNLSPADALSTLATAELVPNASLVHDDLQDRDRSRNDVGSAWATFGEGVSIGSSDVLLSSAHCALSGISHSQTLPTLISLERERVSDACIDQCANLTNELPTTVTAEVYERLAALKSGPLLSLPMELALAACGQVQALPAMQKTADSVAIGYQIFDDLNGMQGDVCRPDFQPAINAVEVLESINVNSDPVTLAKNLAPMHSAIAAEWSLELANDCGQFRHLLAVDLNAQIRSASA